VSARSCCPGARSSSATIATSSPSHHPREYPHKCVIDVTLVPPPAHHVGTSGLSPRPVAGGGLCPRRHADSRWARLPRPALGLRQAPCETPPSSPRESAPSVRPQPFVTALCHISPPVTPHSERPTVTLTPCHTVIPPLRDRIPSALPPIPGRFFFSRRCSPPPCAIYFIVDRRGSLSLPHSETLTSHSEPRPPSLTMGRV
jgi:hypothetical protein